MTAKYQLLFGWWVVMGLVILLLICRIAKGQQLMSPELVEGYQKLLPQVESEEYREALRSPQALIYTHREIPPAYQFGHTFHSTSHNLSGDPSDSGLPDGFGGNANVDFPWRVTGGTDEAEANTDSFKLMILPRAKNGVPWPVVVYNEPLPGPIVDSNVKWMFPIGTEFYEVMLIRDSKGAHYAYEIRVRMRRKDYWDVDILRPFPNKQDLVNRVAEVAPEYLQEISRSRTTYLESLYDGKNRNFPGFTASTAVVDYLPKLPEKVSAELLQTTKFKSCLGDYWLKNRHGTAFAPMGNQSFGIVPKGYTATFFGGDHYSCRQCHATTQVAARMFDRNRGWYGAVRGCDAIFSFHPADPSMISYNGFNRGYRLNPRLIQMGYVARYNSSIHPASMYHSLDRQEKPVQ